MGEARDPSKERQLLAGPAYAGRTKTRDERSPGKERHRLEREPAKPVTDRRSASNGNSASSPTFNPNSKVETSYENEDGERTPLACGFRRRAENFFPHYFSRKHRKVSLTKVRTRRPNSHAGRARSRFNFGLQVNHTPLSE